jgi:hypothetical protein
MHPCASMAGATLPEAAGRGDNGLCAELAAIADALPGAGERVGRCRHALP